MSRIRRRLSSLAAIGLAVAGIAPTRALASNDADPADGTVFIRLVGNLRILRGEDSRVRRELLLGLADVPVATGSGFIVSPDGWIITNLHVVSGGTRVATIAGEKVEITVDVQRIEVLVPGSPDDPSPRHFQASVSASDPDLDLAVLYVSGQNLPHVPLGDSDAITSGEPVRAIGYPFGEELEIAKPAAAPDSLPAATVSPGSVSSLRRDATGEVRYIQTSAQLHPGASGGPIVDGDGYVVAVAQLELRDTRGGLGVGFGIPVNVVKQFLRRHGLDQRLPAMPLGLGGHLDATAKGLRLRVPDGLTDVSPFRLRVDTAAGHPAVTLRIERLASARALEDIESALLNEGALDRFRASGTARRRTVRMVEGRRIVDGFAKGADPVSGQDLTMVYSLVDLGRERVVARYLGTSDAIALNRSVLQASLAGLELRPLLTGAMTKAIPTNWTPTPAGSTSAPVVVPAGWLVEPGGPTPCGGLGEAALSLAASPAGDFTVQFRAAWRSVAPKDLAKAARACAPHSGSSGEGSYASTVDWWGTPYRIEGVFIAVPGGLWQLEAIAPAATSDAVAPAFSAWVKAIAP